MPAAQDTIDQAKAAYLQAKTSLCSTFAHTPDERLNWSPSPTARTPIQIVAHAAMAVQNIHQWMSGTPFHHKTTADADAAFRASEQKFHSREQVLGFLDDVSANYLAWLDELTPEHLESKVELPFGLGSTPLENGLDAAPNHTRGHIAQLEYIHTIYGDHDWRL